MLNITTEATEPNLGAETATPKKASLKRYVLEKMRTWVNSLLEAERDEFLGRGRHQPLDERHDDYRNGYRPRKINFFGLGEVELRVPRDRKGEFESQWLPEGKGQDAELEAFLAEAFLAGLSTRDLARISEKHLGQKYDSKQVSRIVARATTELEAWRQRFLKGQRYKFLYLDGANFRVRINGHVSVQSFCAVLGVTEENERFEVLALIMGDRERADLWEGVFGDLAQRGLNLEAVELGIMDGLPGLEQTFKKFFPRAQTQRCQKHAKANACRRVAARPEDYHRRAPGATQLDKIFRRESERTISDDWVVRHDNRFFQLEPQSRNYAPARGKVTVCEWPEGRLEIEYRRHPVPWREIAAPTKASEPQPVKEGSIRSAAPALKRRWVPPPDHPWRQAARGGAERRAGL